MQVIVDNVLTSYQIIGSGSPVLFVHGWGDASQSFTPLAKGLENYQSVLVDLPGFGQTQAPQVAWGLNDYAMFIQHFLNKIKVKPTAVVAHSNGGAIVIRGLSNGSLETQKLVLLASSGIRGEYQGRKKALRVVAKAAKVLTLPLPKQFQKKLKVKAYKAIGSDLFVAEHLQDTFKKVVTDDVQADVSKIHIPTLLIYGSEDTATPTRHAQVFLSKLEQGKLEIIQAAGHFVHHDQPHKVAQLIQEFLQ